MEPEENQVSVWVCREEKLVSGLSRRTTCTDVIKVLLEERNLAARARCYSIVEKWRGCERALPHNTRLLRLWSAWGDEQENVRFVLVKSTATAPATGPATATASAPATATATVTATHNATATTATTPATTISSLSRERQRRIVRKAFRKLERMNKRRARAAAKDARSAERMETLVHVVVSQDHTIRQQIRRLEELDAEIDQHEARVHLDRVKAHGANYVQDTYLVGAAEQDLTRGSEEGRVPEGIPLALRLEQYVDSCEEVLRLHEELAERETLAASLTSQIEEELNRRWMERRREELAAKEFSESLGAEEELLEEEQVRTELDTSLYIGLRLNTDLEAVSNELNVSQEIWEAREKELRDLLEKVDSLELDEEDEDEDEDEDEVEACARLKESEGTDMDASTVPSAQSPNGWVEQARGLSKSCDSNDDDSDTGLSSMHSQDSDSVPVCESLV